MRKSAYIITLIAMLPPLGAWAWGGSGTSSSPYTISSAADLQKFANIVNGTNGETKNISACGKLTADITLTSAWTPIGNSNGHFKGTFDGDGHTISGFSIPNYTDVNSGFFGYVEDATIKNFTLNGTMTSSTQITGGENDCSGAVVGRAMGSSTIQDIVSNVNITLTKAQKHLGGVVGAIEGSTVVKGCTYTGTLNAGPSTDCIGGIVGFAPASCSGSIFYCFFNGTLSSSSSTPTMGGILGYTNDESNNFSGVHDCYSCGTFSFGASDYKYVNAIVGRIRNRATTTINNTYLSGKATRACNTDGPSIPASNKAITISVSANDNTYGSVSQTYVNPTSTAATQLQVEAAPKTGYHFTKWSDNNTTANRNDVSLSDNVKLTATFAAHTYGDAVWTWATDGKSASAKITCTVCGNELSGNAAITSAVKTAATCTAKGTTTYTAKVTLNGTQYTATKDVVDIAMLNHSMTTHTATAATCTATGNYLYYTCSRSCCAGKYYKGNDAHTTSTYTNQAATVIAALGHGTTGYTPTYTWGGTYSAATCTFTLKCNKCNGNVVSNQSLTPSKVAANHADATCTADGNERWTAKGNYSKSGDKSYTGTAQTKDYAIPALGHAFTVESTNATYRKSAATCTADAVYYHKCSRCAEKGTSTWTNTGTATGHGHTNGYTPTYTWSDDFDVPSCSFTLKCLDCNANVVDNSSLTSTQTAHTDPTCTATGSTTYRVTGSYSNTKSVAYNENNSKTYTIPALGHDMTENARVDATCTETGMDAYWTCGSDCCTGKFFKDENGTEEWDGMPVLAALGHQYDANGGCPVCGRNPEAKAVYANGTLTFYYDIIDHDGTIYALNTGNTSPGWSSVCSSITSVVFDPSFAAARPTSCYYWFSNCVNLSNITGIEYLNTEEVTSMNGMFRLCKIITSLNLSSFNTSKVTDLSSMFYRCEALTTLNVSGFNTNEVTTMNKMFTECYKLQSLDLSSFNTSKTSNMTEMFLYCNQLKSLTIGNFDMTAAANNCKNMFYLCYSNTLTLKSIPFLKDGTFNTQFEGKTVNLVLDENSQIYKDTNYLPTITNCNHYNQTTPVHVSATCTEDGYDGKTCSYCHNEFDVVVSYALGHDMTAHAHVDATCTTDGNEAYWTCSRCDDKLFKDAEGNALWDALPVLAAAGHHYDADGICEVCDDAPVMDVLNIEDGTAYTARASREVNTLIYTRHFHGSNWTTWYVPFDMELTDEICEQMDFSRINNVHQYDDDDDGIADRTIIESFRQKAGVTLKANYPYLVRAKIFNGGLIIDLCFQDVTVAAAAENSIVCRSMDYCYTFTGTYKDMGDSGNENYSLFDDVDDNNWYHFTKLEPMRHYMTITSRDGGSAPQQADVKLQIIGDEDADGIVSIYSKEQQQMGTYDLMGRKISNKQKGLRIENGKIVFTK